MKDYVLFALFILFWMGVGFIAGYNFGEIETIKNINPEACVSVCAEQFYRFGC